MNKNVLKTLVIISIGALLGFGYYYFIGCNSGACVISSNPYASTLYGAAAGLLMSLPSKNKGKENADNKRN